MITLTKPSATFIPALAQQAFSIASPDGARGVRGRRRHGGRGGRLPADRHVRHRASDRHRPLQFESWTRGEASTLARYEDYWGEKAHLDSLILRPIPDNAARLQALQTGEIQGYDLVEPQDIPTIES